MKAMKFLSVVLLLVAASVCVSSCNKDDDEIAETSIIGTWSQTYESGRYEITETYIFRSDLTGINRYIERDADGRTISSEDWNFEYALSESNGDTYITLVDGESQERYRYEITATRLLLSGEYSDSNPEQYTRQ